MSVVESAQTLSEQQLGLMLQYTVEAYKTFEKLAENLPNPMSAQMFKQFAVDEREHRDLLDMKILAVGATRIRTTLAGDLQFQDILEGDLSFRETTEFLINRERTMEKKLVEWSRTASAIDRNLLRLAIQEMLMNNGAPIRAAINEAVELAKIYGSDNSAKFVNGVLGSVSLSLAR